MTKRKTVQVTPRVHARLDEFWHKLSFGFDYDRSSSGVIEYLMDFYDKHKSPETELALQLIAKVENRIMQDNQIN